MSAGLALYLPYGCGPQNALGNVPRTDIHKNKWEHKPPLVSSTGDVYLLNFFVLSAPNHESH
jgi:hypothetical protein